MGVQNTLCEQRARSAVISARQFVRKTITCWALVAAGVGGALTACSDGTAPRSESRAGEAPTPSQLVALGELQYTATVGTKIEPGPAVRVLDENKRPLPGVMVRFGPEGSKLVLSDADGIARFGPWQLDTVARDYFITVTVSVSVQQEMSMVFHARATPGPVARLTALSGNNQLGRPGRILANQLVAKATDVYNNPVGDAVVSFSVVSGSGKIEKPSSITNSSGLASAGRWTLGTSGPQRVRAGIDQVQVNFDAAFCESTEFCDLVPENLAYVQNGAVWINGADAPFLVADDASRPSWSPDGSRLAFFKVNTNREEEAICIVSEPFSSVACAPVDKLSRDVAGDMRASWSPDGRSLALSRVYYGAGASQLLFLDVASMTLRRHGTIDGSVWSASWSPDGKTIAIASNAKVYLATSDGSGLEVLLPYGVWELAWAPDGQKIAVVTIACPWECYGYGLALLDPISRQLTVLEGLQGPFNGLTWSPDSKQLGYSTWDNVTAISSIRIMNITGAGREVVLTNASQPSWRPLHQ